MAGSELSQAVEQMAAPAAAAQSGNAVVRSLVGGLVTALPVLVIGLLVLNFAPTYYTFLALGAFVNLIVVVGLQVFMGNSNIANLGHSAFVGLGAYGVAILSTPLAMKKLSIPNAPFGFARLELDPVSSALIALLVVGIMALVSGKVISRLSGVAATIVSLALLIIVHSVFLNWTDLFKGNQAFFGIPKVVGLPWMLVFAVLAIVAARLFKDSRWGLQLRASAQSPQAAAALGIDAKKLRLMSWVLSALICGLAGVLYAYFAGTISPKLFYFQMIFNTLAMLILGGMATVTGAVTGVIVLSIGLEFIRSIESGVTVAGIQMPQLLGLSGVALGVVIVLCMAFRPSGISGRHELDELVSLLFRRNAR
ncbi:branched-chain amino acid ABC transporter permease [Mesorhizobium sp. M2A.F.Ca.ET.043.05.1.1]|uniref:branched-chain amino acid ABC transporter permease n=1 Tax=Mesorhizobium sp. M2A.F.Ca.ET.043.05.1.1 TaxID=2493671 RepID=UPI001FE1E15D|nr:branched-chain amino acid ABC transporter permease [Mesorhizobium sp. M2A.F.Ca.ET.043.05.1.1]